MRNQKTGIIRSNAEIRQVITDSTWAYRNQLETYCYVYLHKIDDKVFYVGMGSHDRAVKIAGRSDLWYLTAVLEKVTVYIVKSGLKREVAEALEKKQIELYKETCINYTYDKYDKVPVIQFTMEGKIVRNYESMRAASLEGFDERNIEECCQGRRGVHGRFAWMYKKDFDSKGFKAKKASNHPRMIEQLKDGKSVRTLFTAAAFEQFGLNPNNIQQVCTGSKLSHQGFKFRYVDSDK